MTRPVGPATADPTAGVMWRLGLAAAAVFCLGVGHPTAPERPTPESLLRGVEQARGNVGVLRMQIDARYKSSRVDNNRRLAVECDGSR